MELFRGGRGSEKGIPNGINANNEMQFINKRMTISIYK